jgi:signal transduction histidine kinase
MLNDRTDPMAIPAESSLANDLPALRTLLRDLPLFGHLGDDDLDRLVDDSALQTLQAGQVLIEEGDPATTAYVVVEGELEILRRTGGRDVPLGVRAAGEIVGEMSMLTGDRRNATVRAHTPARVLPITRAALDGILASNPAAALALLRLVMQRLKGAEAQLVGHQKMAALGTLAAGLAHELNNPAAALARGAEQLRAAVIDWEQRAEALGAMTLGSTERGTLDVLRGEMHTRAAEVALLDPLARGDRERAVQRRLEAAGFADAWQLSPLLVDAGWDVESIAALEARFAPEHRSIILWWLALGQNVLRLLHELSTSAGAISAIVTAVKGYTRLDQAPVQEVDVHEGIEQSLTILRHKLRDVGVARQYAANLSRITAYAGELNQVWTNLIDNAADAMNGHGELSIRTARDGDWVVVEIGDTGPGIPPQVQARIFEPFYTTKPPGQGTGLGLSITYSIVRKHGGDIQFDSRPGRTRAIVRLPAREVT